MERVELGIAMGNARYGETGCYAIQSYYSSQSPSTNNAWGPRRRGQWAANLAFGVFRELEQDSVIFQREAIRQKLHVVV